MGWVRTIIFLQLSTLGILLGLSTPLWLFICSETSEKAEDNLSTLLLYNFLFEVAR